MRLTEQSRYALRVLAYCAEHHPQLAKVAEISNDTGITEQNIFKLIKTLAKTGFLQTVRGPHGGVRLAAAPSAIAVGQVIRAVEPRFQACGPLDRMMSEAPVSDIERALDRTIGRGIAAFIEALDQTSIASLVTRTPAPNVAA
jgi:Rrf2 family protein